MSYENAKKSYAAIGVDTDAAIEKLKKAQIALHCWQGMMSEALTLTPKSLLQVEFRQRVIIPEEPEPRRS